MIRTRICLYLLLLTPLAVYWQTIFHEYGLRDDYSYLREAREEPGKLVKFTASHGRPLYGALLETSYFVASNVSGLPWLRLISVGMLTLLGLALWRQLYQSGWTEVEAAAIGLGIVLLPAAQVTASWALGWPYALTLLLALAGFSAIETELERGGLKRVVALIGGCMIYMLAGLIYQSDALFALVPIAAVLIVRTGREPMKDHWWAAIHLVTLLIGLGLSYLLVQGLFNNDIFQESARMKLETNPFTKFAWFLWQPLPNALALYALRDDFNTGAVIFWLAAAAVATLIGYGYKFDAARGDPLLRKKWILCLTALPLLAHSVSLVAAERSTGYRVLFTLSSLVVVMVVFAIRSLRTSGLIAQKKPYQYYAVFLVIGAIAALSAHHNSFTLIAQPQGHEWEMVRNAVMRQDFKKPLNVYLVRARLEDRSTERVFRDEFGSISSDSDWTPKEMFKAAVHERFGDKPPKSVAYNLTTGAELPADEKAYDLVIDMRRLRQKRPE